MTQQKSENGIVPADRGNPAPTQGVESRGGGKAVSVKQSARQLELIFTTAEHPQGADAGVVGDLSPSMPDEVPKVRIKDENCQPTMMEEMTKGLTKALHRVASNKGAPGPDGVTTKMLVKQWNHVLPKLTASLLNGRYRPGDIRRVYIPKPGGGQRGLGIPNVIDRVVQEAVRQVLEPLHEPRFHPSSHGFRPKRSCHTAITEAYEYLSEGCEWVVDIDLEKFFDRVCHQRLMARLAQQVPDRSLLVLVGRMLKAKVILPEGVVMSIEEGVPQGGPLSPLLSNIVLDELDWELAQRGHRFVRYADDVNIFVQSERAGQRVMASITRFIEGRLRLKVNVSKSAVARPDERHFLGFRLRVSPKDGSVNVWLSKRTQERAMAKIYELTPRNWGNSLRRCILRINAYLRGWHNFFGICSASALSDMRTLDAHIRRRLRALKLKQWKCKRTIARNLISLGVKRRTAWRRVYEGRKSLWALSHTSVVERGLSNAHFAALGLVSLAALHRSSSQTIAVPKQGHLFGGNLRSLFAAGGGES